MSEYEYKYAVYEAHLIDAINSYFEARPQLFNTAEKRKLFEAGFERAYKIQREKIEALEQQLKTARHEAVEQYLEGQLKSVKLSRSLQNKSPLI